MSLFVFHDVIDLVPAALVLRALSGADLASDAVVCTPSSGAPLAGVVARWWRWSLREGAPDAMGRSTSEDGGEAFTTQGGWVAWVDGSTTAYVVCTRVGLREDSLVSRRIMDAASAEATAPRVDPANPMPASLVELAASLSAALKDAGVPVGRGRSGSIELCVTRSWVQLDTAPGDAFQVVEVDGGLELSGVIGVFVDAPGAAEGVADQEAARILKDELADVATGLGFRRRKNYTTSTASERHDGSAVESWSQVVPDVAAAAAVLRAANSVALCLTVTLDV